MTSSSAATAAAKKSESGYHLECSGPALETVKRRSGPPNADKTGEGLKLFGASFCPFVHRVWIALELLNVDYEYIEVDPYKKPKELLDVNPRGLVPALKIGEEGKCLGESTVILEYLADRYGATDKPAMLPRSDAYHRALARLGADKVNRNLIPSFYRYLQAQEPEKQAEGAEEFTRELQAFTASMQEGDGGPFWDGSNDLGWVDIQIVPWVFRASTVLKHYRGFDLDGLAKKGGRFDRWWNAITSHPAFKATTSNEDLYLDSYARYAENRPHTSQVATAINSGRGLP